MQSPTKKITTPLSKTEVILKDWITGADAEYIEEALMESVEVTPDMKNKSATIGKFDTKAIKNQTHREIEKFVVSVGGETKDIVALVTALPEDDYEFVKSNILDRRIKKKVD